MHKVLLLVSMLLLFLGSCKSKSQQQATDGKGAENQNVDSISDSNPKELALTPLSFDGVSIQKSKESYALTTQGKQQLGSGKLDKAVESFFKALRIDPGNLHARYSLATALLKQEKTQEALLLLGEFKKVNSPRCQDKLLQATQDLDFKGIQSNPKFIELTSEVVKNHSDNKDLIEKTKNISALLKRFVPTSLGDDGMNLKLDEYLDQSVSTEIIFDAIETVDAGLIEESRNDHVTGKVAVMRMLMDMKKKISPDGTSVLCRDSCCRLLPLDEHEEERSDENLTLVRLCFSTAEGKDPKVSKIHMARPLPKI